MRISDWSSDVCSSDLTKPSCSIAFSTAARVLSVRNSDRLITRLTVFFETPASAATSLIVGCLPPGPLFCAALLALSPAGPLVRPALCNADGRFSTINNRQRGCQHPLHRRPSQLARRHARVPRARRGAHLLQEQYGPIRKNLRDKTRRKE